jgi:quercetin dioxygenase-like cupin family protein
MNFRHLGKGDGTKMIVLGDNQTIKLTGKDTNGQFTLIEQFDEPGVGIPPHIHYNEDELFCILEGSLKVTINGDTKIVNEGDVVFCPRGISHSWVVIGDKKAKTLLTIVPAGLENMFEELSKLDKGLSEIEKVIKITNRYNIKFVKE